MPTFAVTYDLIKRKDYPTLWAELERLGAQRALESFWLLDLDYTAKAIHDHLRQYMDSDDRLWVSEYTSNAAASQVLPGTTAWIKKHPARR